MTWGGKRPGSGRKPKTKQEKDVTGARVRPRGRVLPHPSSAEAPVSVTVDESDAPNDLSTDERNVWMDLAPLALAKRTLSPATSLAFRMLCRNVVLERSMMKNLDDRGGSNHRGMIQRVDAELLAFDLRPCGKAMFEEAKQEPVNPVQKFLNRKRG